MDPGSSRRGPRRPAVALTSAELMPLALDYLRRFDTSRQRLRLFLIRKVARAAARAGGYGEDAASGATDPDGEPGTDDRGGVPAELRAAIDAVVAELTARGLLDDQRHAEARATALHARGVAPAVARLRLREAGIGGALAEAAQAAVRDEAGQSPAEAALQAAWTAARRRRIGPFREPALRAAERERDLQRLLRAGHSFDAARKVIDANTIPGPGGEADEHGGARPR